jgi:hypothetical protein
MSVLRWNMLEACALCRNLNQTGVVITYFLWKKKFQIKSRGYAKKGMQHMPCIHGVYATDLRSPLPNFLFVPPHYILNSITLFLCCQLSLKVSVSSTFGFDQCIIAPLPLASHSFYLYYIHPLFSGAPTLSDQLKPWRWRQQVYLKCQ